MTDAAAAAAPAGPVQLFLELSSVCNLRCSHCYVRAGEGPRRELQPAVVCGLIGEFSELGGQMVSISGGEPTLYPEWRSVARFARFQGLDTMILTNGTRISDDDIAFLRDLGCAVAVSLDGAGPDAHDIVRGNGNFEAVTATLGRLVVGGMAGKTTLMFTPMATNFGDLPGIVALAQRLGIGSVYVSLLEDRGRAHDRLSHLDSGDSSDRSLIYSILGLQERYPHIAIQCLNLKLFTERLRSVDLETEGLDRTIRVTADGKVYLTAYLDDEPFQLGEIGAGSLRDFWFSDRVQSALSAAEKRSLGVTAGCRSCFAWPWCRGGSAAFAWNHSGSFEGEDGFCDAKRAIVREMDLAGSVFQRW